jgi:hypothetical protein
MGHGLKNLILFSMSINKVMLYFCNFLFGFDLLMMMIDEGGMRTEIRKLKNGTTRTRKKKKKSPMAVGFVLLWDFGTLVL